MNRVIFIGFLVMALCVHQSFCQIKITGQVTDTRNNPIALASIDVVGQNVSSTTDDSGVFFLSLNSNTKKGDIITLRISKGGYMHATRHIAVSYISIPIKLIRDKQNKNTSALNKKTDTPATVRNTKTIIQNQPITVSSQNQSGGITAGQVLIAPPARHISDAIKNELLQGLPNKDERIDVVSVWGDNEAFQFANEIFDFLKSEGYKKLSGVDQAAYTRPVFGQVANRDSLGCHIVIGSRR